MGSYLIMLIRLVTLLLILFHSRIAYGYDVAILYDFSGSLEWSRKWKQALNQIRRDMITLISDGEKLQDETWEVKVAPTYNHYVTGGLLKEGQHLVYLEFAEPTSTRPPFFSKYKTYSIGNVWRIPDLLERLLPGSESVHDGNWTYLDLAKWQAMDILDELGADQTQRILIIVSDFIPDPRGKYKKNRMMIEAENEYLTQFREETLLKANWKGNNDQLERLGFELLLVKPITVSEERPTPSTSSTPAENIKNGDANQNNNVNKNGDANQNDNVNKNGDVGKNDEAGKVETEKHTLGSIWTGLLIIAAIVILGFVINHALTRNRQ